MRHFVKQLQAESIYREVYYGATNPNVVFAYNIIFSSRRRLKSSLRNAVFKGRSCNIFSRILNGCSCILKRHFRYEITKYMVRIRTDSENIVVDVNIAEISRFYALNIK